MGRFISEDPIKDGSNWYAYVANNPLRYVDPTGLRLDDDLDADYDRSKDRKGSEEERDRRDDDDYEPRDPGDDLRDLKDAENGLNIDLPEEKEGDTMDPLEEAAGITGDFLGRNLENVADYLNDNIPNPLKLAERNFKNTKDLIEGLVDAVSGETDHTKKGRLAHKQWDPGEDYEKEMRLDSGRRPDAVNIEEKHVIELKPNNPRAIKRGEKQVERYRAELEKMYGGEWTSEVVTYD